MAMCVFAAGVRCSHGVPHGASSVARSQRARRARHNSCVALHELFALAPCQSPHDEDGQALACAVASRIARDSAIPILVMASSTPILTVRICLETCVLSLRFSSSDLDGAVGIRGVFDPGSSWNCSGRVAGTTARRDVKGPSSWSSLGSLHPQSRDMPLRSRHRHGLAGQRCR